MCCTIPVAELFPAVSHLAANLEDFFHPFLPTVLSSAVFPSPASMEPDTFFLPIPNLKLLPLCHSFYLIFNWRIIALQCYISFCYTTKWKLYVYIYPLPYEPPFPLCMPSHHRAQSWASCATSSFLLAVLHMVVDIRQCYSLSSSYPLAPCPHVFPTSVSLFLHCK